MSKPKNSNKPKPEAKPEPQPAPEPGPPMQQQQQPSQVDQLRAQANQAIGTQNELFSQALQQLARGAIEAGNSIGDRNAVAIMRLASERDQVVEQLKRTQGLLEKSQADLSSARAELEALKRSLEKVAPDA